MYASHYVILYYYEYFTVYTWYCGTKAFEIIMTGATVL